jgi:hypothetical protein
MTYGGMLEFKLSVIEKAATESRIALRDAYPFGGYAFTSMSELQKFWWPRAIGNPHARD